MGNKIFKKEKWLEILKGLKDEYELYVPFKDGDFHIFKHIDEVKKPDFDYENTRLSPKGLVYPQSERLFEYSLDPESQDANIIKESSKDYTSRVIVGLRPCDAKAFQIVKRNFDNPEYRDPWWVKRYETTLLVGLGCNNPCSTCFCTSASGGPFDEDGLDVILFDLGDRFLAKSISDNGEKFLGMADGEEPGDSDHVTAKALSDGAEKKIVSRVETEKLSSKVTNKLFEAKFWDDVAFACLNCGTCTFLCPTCWCFDIQDEVNGKEGDRIRNWDTCMSPLFTLEGSGHNPRTEKTQRVRQRFMHKLKYYVDKYEEGIQCSGCGRCVKHCPVNIDIREVCELMNSYKS